MRNDFGGKDRHSRGRRGGGVEGGGFNGEKDENGKGGNIGSGKV